MLKYSNLVEDQHQVQKHNAGDRNAVLREYEFIDIFPTNVSSIDLSYDSSDTIEEFVVDFAVQSFAFVDAGGPNG